MEEKLKTLINRHETYLSSLEADDESSEEWLSEIENNFSNAKIKYTKYKMSISETSCKKGLEIKEIEVHESINLICKMI